MLYIFLKMQQVCNEKKNVYFYKLKKAQISLGLDRFHLVETHWLNTLLILRDSFWSLFLEI